MLVGSLFLAWVGMLAALGLARHECLLLASAALAAFRIDLWRLRQANDIDSWRLGLRCLLSGSIGLVIAAAVGVACLITIMMGWCEEAGGLTISLIAVTGAVLCGMQTSARRTLLEASPWLILLGGAAVASLGAKETATAWACLAVGATVVYLAACIWSLAREGTVMLSAATER